MVDQEHSVNIPAVALKLAVEVGKRYEILSNGSTNSVEETDPGFSIPGVGGGGCKPCAWGKNLLFDKIFTEN